MLVAIPFWLWKELKQKAKKCSMTISQYVRLTLNNDINDEW